MSRSQSTPCHPNNRASLGRQRGWDLPSSSTAQFGSQDHSTVTRVLSSIAAAILQVLSTEGLGCQGPSMCSEGPRSCVPQSPQCRGDPVPCPMEPLVIPLRSAGG